jgi:excinuclease UvrABC nuclease subunit
MAIECFEINWTKPFPLEKIARQIEAKRGGIYFIFKSGVGKPYYIGKATNFEKRLNTHKQAFSRIMSEAELKRCTVRLGLISSFETTHMSDTFTSTQLGSIENFFITQLQPKGNGGNTKKRDTGKYPLIAINTGNLCTGMGKYMSQSNDLLKALGKSTTKKRASSASWL